MATVGKRGKIKQVWKENKNVLMKGEKGEKGEGRKREEIEGIEEGER